jgi:uncharacterized membrane protein
MMIGRLQCRNSKDSKDHGMDLVPVDVLSRWLHVLSAITLLGGAIFSRFVLLPSAAELPEAEHDQLRAGVVKRWKRFVHLGIALLLITGFYNFARAMPGHKGQPLYHSLLGTKILLAFAVFFLASVLVGRSSLAESARKNAKTWLVWIVLLGTLTVIIGGYAKVALPNRPAVTESPG